MIIFYGKKYGLKYDYLNSGGSGYDDNGNLAYICPWWENDNNWTGADRIYATAFWTLQKAQYFFKNIIYFDYTQFGQVNVQLDTLDILAEYNRDIKEIRYSRTKDGVWNSPASIDLLCHEYGHHIISSVSNGLDDSYYMEPGAINEGYADIFGKSVQNYIEGYNETRIETMGEDVVISDSRLKRSCNNPNSMGYHFVGSSSTPVLGQPDTYSGVYWYDGYHDEGGVHVNSGVINFWFYLLSKGGSGYNDFNDYYEVSGIGIEKGAKIVYNSLPLLLFEAEFTDARNATIIAAENLYGIGSNESQQVLNAWEAVAVDGNCLSSEIVAPDFICSGTSVSINNLPDGATIEWNNGSYILRTSPQDSNPCTFTAIGSGNSWIEATINSDCGNVTLPKKYVWAGMPVTPTEIIPFWNNGMEFGNDSYYDFRVNPHPSVSYYTWDVDGGTIISGQGTHWITVKTQKITGNFNVNFSVGVRAGNLGCGESSRFVRTGWVIPGTGGATMAFTPNPTTGETTLTIETVSEEKTFDETAPWELEVYSPMQALKTKKTRLKGKSTTIQTAGWTEGVYTVRVKYQDEILTGKLVVKR